MSWKIEHKRVIESFLEYLNQVSDKYILKGGTALLMCYKLDRFSEDIDLDCRKSAEKESIIDLVKKFSEINKYSFRIAKNTDTTKKCMLNYGNEERPLQIEVSYRRKEISNDEYTKINGIHVYKLDPLCVMKIAAYSGRDKIRDVYDITFITKNYFEDLQSQTISFIRNIIEYKGLEHFDYLLNTQSDFLIDKDKLANDFLDIYDKLGLVSQTYEYEDEYTEEQEEEWER